MIKNRLLSSTTTVKRQQLGRQLLRIVHLIQRPPPR